MELRREAHRAKDACGEARSRCDVLAAENASLKEALAEARSDAGKYERRALDLATRTDELEVVCAAQRDELDAAKTAWRAETTARRDADETVSRLQHALDSTKVDRAKLLADLEECGDRRRAEATLHADEARTLRLENERLTFAADE